MIPVLFFILHFHLICEITFYLPSHHCLNLPFFVFLSLFTEGLVVSNGVHSYRRPGEMKQTYNMTSEVNRLIGKLDRTEERISDLKEGFIKTIQAETQRGKKRIKGNQNRAFKADWYDYQEILRLRKREETELTGSFRGIRFCDCGSLLRPKASG